MLSITRIIEYPAVGFLWTGTFNCKGSERKSRGDPSQGSATAFAWKYLKTAKKLRQDKGYPSLDSNLGPTEYPLYHNKKVISLNDVTAAP